MDLVMLSYKKAIKGFGPIFEDADRCQEIKRQNDRLWCTEIVSLLKTSIFFVVVYVVQASLVDEDDFIR